MSEPQSVEAMRAELSRLRAEVEWLRGMTEHTEDCPKSEAVKRAVESLTYGKLLRLTEGHGTSELYEILRDALAAYRERA